MTELEPPRPSRIAVLPPALADQIAAGEVVERAASVVKELCENAVDAGARRIEIEIEGGGRRLIRVADDGGGMTADEARLALRRHATSKIRSADDLWGLTSFGFRGEALPSIAAVSRLSLSTKLPGATGGFRLTVEAGLETEARDVGMPEGTHVEVRELFFNTPARLKFQKTEATEAANVNEAVLRLALAHPDVHFRLRAAGRTVLDLPVHRDLGERVRAALARRGAGALHEARGEEGGHEVRAFLAAPEAAATTARSTFLFVGRRFVRDRSLLHALALGYGELLEKGRYPLAALFLEVPGQDLDVNVHPQKLEVRFARAAEVYAAVRHVVGAAVARAPWLPAPRGAVRVHTLPPETRDDGTSVAIGGGGQLHLARTSGYGARLPRFGAADAAPVTAPAFPSSLASPAAVSSWPAAPQADDSSAYFQSLSYIGQLDRTYLVCETRGELVLVDQHAAHERVAFERLRVAHGRAELRRQRLLFPIPIELDDSGAAAAAEDAAMAGLGFEVERTGERTVLLRAVPELLKDADPKPLLAEVLGRLADGETTSSFAAAPTERFERILATMACHSVVRAGDVLSRPQALALLMDLDRVDLRMHCPHGRPVLLRLPLAEIERRFGRS
ncbi:MAG TPA: DNA mismatch repair endonuclease MutL [Polyangia bacterium]|jgi:DNA mismatch repair protein MutL